MRRVIGAAWLSPVTVPFWLFYVLPLWALGKIKSNGSAGYLVAWFYLVDDGGWYARRWRGWSGFAGPMFIITRRAKYAREEHRILVHESRHVDQWFVLGPLFLIVYGLFMSFGYVDNPLEVDAKAHE